MGLRKGGMPAGILQARVAHLLFELGHLEIFPQIFPDGVAEEHGGAGAVGGEHVAVQPITGYLPTAVECCPVLAKLVNQIP